MCQHRHDNLTPSRSAHLCAAKGNGFSPLPQSRVSFTAPAVATTNQNAAEPDGGIANIPPSKLDVAFGALVFAGFALLGFAMASYLAAREWLALKRVCSWCKIRMGGNPLTRNVTHGICPHCYNVKKREIAQVVPIRHLTATGTAN